MTKAVWTTMAAAALLPLPVANARAADRAALESGLNQKLWVTRSK